MQQLLPVSDHLERVSLVNNIKSQWKVANPTDVIPADIQYPKFIGAWPLPILRAISYLARSMPGEEGRKQFVHLLNNGYLTRKEDADESATFEPQLQLSDLEFVRDSVGLPPAPVPAEEEVSEGVVDAGQVMESKFSLSSEILDYAETDRYRCRIC